MEGGAQLAGGVAVAAFALPALGFALGPLFEDVTPTRWQDVGPEDDFNDETYVPKVISIVPEVGDAGKTTIYVRTFNPDKDKVVEGEDSQPYVAISTRCAHLGCPVRYIQASEKFVCPCHGGVYGFEGQVEGGPPVRPLDRFYTRVTGPRRDRRPLLAELAAAPLLPARPVEPPRRALAVPLPVEADHMKLPPHRFRRPCAPRPSAPARAATARTAATARRRPSRRPRTTWSRAPPPRSAGSTSAPAPARSCAASSTARCPRARTGSTRSARPRCSPSSRRRSPACSWRCTTSRTRRAPTSRPRTSPTTSSSASSCAACTSGARR